jgi:hypothetical protein
MFIIIMCCSTVAPTTVHLLSIATTLFGLQSSGWLGLVVGGKGSPGCNFLSVLSIKSHCWEMDQVRDQVAVRVMNQVLVQLMNQVMDQVMGQVRDLMAIRGMNDE